jgi:predicted metal-dependent hydrolase
MIGVRARRFRDGEVVEVDGAPVRLKVNARARRVSLRLDPVRREVVATAPSARRLSDAVAFARERSQWMLGLLARAPRTEALAPGQVLEVLGRPLMLEIAPSPRGQAVSDTAIVAHGAAEAYPRAVVRLLRRHALKVLRQRTYVHAAALGVSEPEVKVMDARTRWGSCTPPRAGRRGVVRYSWRLVLAPEWVLDYVTAHEAAHLVRADHSPAFWAEVAKLTPNAGAARAWLKAHAARLHATGA